ncbi:MAG: XdhC family protein [Ardenticatenales bacterium]|nr:XdhC family protein [Ardenticatenales bacterium]
MQEVIADIDRWQADGHPVALATVIETWGSAPRKVGAKLALTPAGGMAGSVSGGCVEGAVFAAGVETLESGRPQLLTFGVADETAWDVGLACGGSIKVFVEPLPAAVYAVLREGVLADEGLAVTTVIAGPDNWLGTKAVVGPGGVVFAEMPASLQTKALAAAKEALTHGRSQSVTVNEPQPCTLFVEAILPLPNLIMVGGVHIAVALTHMARTLGYRTVVIDPRRAFGNTARFPHADQVIQAWPDKAFPQVKLNQGTAVAMLTHDPKIDDPALKIVLPSAAFYVGALGSRGTQEKRRRRLENAGIPPHLIQRIHGPIGLDINAQTPEEIALSIMAEIVAARRPPMSNPGAA